MSLSMTTHTVTARSPHISTIATCEHCNNHEYVRSYAGDLSFYGNTISQQGDAHGDWNVRSRQQSPNSPRTASSPFMLGPPSPYSDIHLDSETDAHVLQFHRDHVVPLIFRPHSHLVYHSALSKNHHGHQFPPLKDALLATAAIRLAGQRPEYHALAADYYDKALHGLALALNEGRLLGTEDFFLETVTWLGFYETKLPGHLRNAAAHFTTSVNLFGLRRRQRRCKCQHQLLEKLLAETTLFACSTLALFDPAMAAIPLQTLRDNIGPLLSELQAPTKSPMVDSPFLGLPAELYFLMFEASQLFHRDPAEALSATLQAQDLLRRLTLLDSLAGNGAPDPLYEHHMQHASYEPARITAYRLHLKACLSLVTFWLRREEQGSLFEPERMECLQQGLALMTAQSFAEIGRSYDVTWPIKAMGGMLRSRCAVAWLGGLLGGVSRWRGCEQFGGVLESLGVAWGKRVV